MRKRKLLQQALHRPNNLRFAEMKSPVEAFGFRLHRITGSHHIFNNPTVQELVNLQNVKGKAKPYQVRQFLSPIERYNLKLEDSE